ncbi:vWA domain-containing protein [Roseovarius nitratireducens]|uniref:vWA domain-containing protein n=1 Tax=Roseovarius nitratireducens TaxID=2044597 RepID=UPI000CE22F73|nr:VWA domain-containing protein [Roseovarius nitratireducens]
MSRVARFAARDPGVAARITGFLAHLRAHGFGLGVAEAETALRALEHVCAADPEMTRRALKAVCAGSADEVTRFDEFYDAFWLNDGRVRLRVTADATSARSDLVRAPGVDEDRATGTATGRIESPDDGGGGETDAEGSGRLIASGRRNLMTTDLREVVSPADVAEAEAVAERLGRALRDHRSRRRKAARRGRAVDLRRTIRKSLGTGGEPLRLERRTRPDRPVRVTALCDVSGSMAVYARPFLAFLSGLMRADPDTDAYLFHTRLVRIADALRETDALRALNRLSLLADGFGGGSCIGASLDHFSRSYARRLVNGRTVVLILSDGYDSADPEEVGAALARIRRRGCRIIWLNPLKGWKGYEPVARGMAAALPHLDLFAPATTLADLAALEPELVRL